MNRIGLYVIAVLVALTLLLFTCTFSVRFNEQAIVTTFGEAGEGSRVTEPGLKFKWPYPVQRVIKFDTRANVLETRLESAVTNDQELVAVRLFLAWRISDVRTFFREVATTETASRLLNDRLRSAQGVISRYDFDELLAFDDDDRPGMATIEQEILDLLHDPGGETPDIGAYGIEPIVVGITQFVLPETTTTAVFERMRQTRQKLATDARSEGEAEKTRIEVAARTKANRIRSFAERYASRLRAVGEEEAAEMLAEMARTPEAERLAVFLRRLDALSATLRQNTTTVILPPMSPFDLLGGPPEMPATIEPEDAAVTAEADGG